MKTAPAKQDEMRDFMLVVRRALLMIVAFIEKRYNASNISE